MIEELDEIFNSDQEERIHPSNGMESDETPIETKPDENTPVEDSFLPFGNIDLSDEKVIIDEIIPSKKFDKDPTQLDKGEES